MSFWDNVKKLAQPYADDDYDDYDDDYEDDDYEEVEAPARRSSRRTPAAAPAAPVAAPVVAPVSAPAPERKDNFGFSAAPTAVPSVAPASGTGFSGHVVSSASGRQQDVVLFRPSSFNDSSKAADDLRKAKAVIVNMENVDKAMARRVVDFLSGCVYALNGTVRKIAQSAYLFCPNNVNVVGDLETIQSDAESYI